MLKILFMIGVYLALVFALGFVLAVTPPRERFENHPGDDDES